MTTFAVQDKIRGETSRSNIHQGDLRTFTGKV